MSAPSTQRSLLPTDGGMGRRSSLEEEQSLLDNEKDAESIGTHGIITRRAMETKSTIWKRAFRLFFTLSILSNFGFMLRNFQLPSAFVSEVGILTKSNFGSLML